MHRVVVDLRYMPAGRRLDEIYSISLGSIQRLFPRTVQHAGGEQCKFHTSPRFRRYVDGKKNLAQWLVQAFKGLYTSIRTIVNPWLLAKPTLSAFDCACLLKSVNTCTS